ncbi:MAG TPA: SWIM zinc finger family protein [Candidatus Methylomirabilis sp.]|nr:SWIM zinc finger family protein [Candidatus Methylomirabilis sp.]
MAYRGWERGWVPYVRVAERRFHGVRHAARLATKGRKLRAVLPAARGRALVATFWGRAWCDNLAAYATLANRLERGRSYLRNGLVIDLQIAPGSVTALVSGTSIYEISVKIKPMPRERWRAVVKACAGRIDSVVELLAGRFDESVMAEVCRQDTGLFPTPTEITYQCTCPDGFGGGWLCKHVAATLYGVGVRLDEDPEMLFRLRQVAHAELLASATARLADATGPRRTARRGIADDRLSAVFGIDLDTAPAPRARSPRRPLR